MKAARISFGYALIVEWFVILQIMPNILLHIPQQQNSIQKFCQLWQMTSVESNHYLHAAEIHFTSDLKKAATGFPLYMYYAHAHAQDLWRCGPLCAPLNKANKSKKSCICFLSCLCDSILLRRNGFYINFSCCRFLCPAYPSLSRCVSTALFLLIIGFYVAVAMILFLLLVLVWQQQDFFFLLLVLVWQQQKFFLPLVLVWQQQNVLWLVLVWQQWGIHLLLCLSSWVGEMLGWNLKGMWMNDEVL